MFNLKKIGHSEANEKVIASTKLEDSGKNLIGDKLHILYNIAYLFHRMIKKCFLLKNFSSFM